MGAFEFGSLKEFVKGCRRERIDRVEFKSERVKSVPRINTMLPNCAELTIVAEEAPKEGDDISSALMTWGA